MQETSQGNGDTSPEDGSEARGRTAKRVTRLEQTLGETRTQLDRARGRRDELEQLLQRMVDTETARRDRFRAREQELEQLRATASSLREQLEQGSSVQDALAQAEAGQREARDEADVLREQLFRLESERDELLETRSQAAGAEEERRELEAQLADARARADEVSSLLAQEGEAHAQLEQQLRAEVGQAVADVEQARADVKQARAEAERASAEADVERQRRSGYESTAERFRGELDEERGLRSELEQRLGAEAEQARAEAEEERERDYEHELAADRLRAELEQARSVSADEQEWQTELEARLAETEKQAESVLRDINEELELTLGRAALERERRAAAEARLTQAAETEQSLRDRLGLMERELESARDGGGESWSQSESLARAERHIQELHDALEAERQRDPGELAAGEQIGDLATELESVRSEAETVAWSLEQSRRRVLQLENELAELRGDASGEEADLDSGSRARFRSVPRPGKESRAPVKDPAELADMDDLELAEAFGALREAAKLADDRDDREAATAHRALARAAAEEAADRETFGEAPEEGSARRRFGRKRGRALRELEAAREKALQRRPISVTSADRGDEEAE